MHNFHTNVLKIKHMANGKNKLVLKQPKRAHHKAYTQSHIHIALTILINQRTQHTHIITSRLHNLGAKFLVNRSAITNNI